MYENITALEHALSQMKECKKEHWDSIDKIIAMYEQAESLIR